MKIKKLLFSALAAVATMLPASAATWNTSVGMGNNGGEWQFFGAGTPLSVIPSVISNSSYYITSAKADGAPWIQRLLVKNDLTGFNLDIYIATNSWTIASNAVAATNIFWLTSTNAGMATNDILVFRDVANDCYQMSICGSNAGSATGLVYTNALGQCAFQTYNPLTNAAAANDIVYKMARVARFNPFSDYTITNKVLSPWGNWLNIGDLVAGQSLNLRGPIGIPILVVQNYSNAASLHISGEYYVRPRR